MTVNVGHLFRKRTVRNLAGQIVDMTDESNGGIIISKGNIINQERFAEIKRVEDDKKFSAHAITQQASAPQAVVEERTIAPTKTQELEKRIDSMEGNVNKILELLQKK
jgi:hypothetical protein